MRVRAFIACLFLLCASRSFGANTPDVPFVFHPSGISNELSQQSVRQVFQDSTGFLWILTQEGLNRYDGKQVTIYRSDINIPGTLTGNYTRGMVEDQAGNLWIGTHGGGINLYHPESDTFSNIDSEGEASESTFSDRIWSVNLGPDGQIWIGYREGGFSVFDPNSRLFRHFTKHNWPVLGDFPVSDIEQDQDGTVWIAADGAGVFRLDASQQRLELFASASAGPLAIPSNQISDIHRDAEGYLWIASYSGASRIGPQGDWVETITRLHDPRFANGDANQNLEPLQVVRIFEDRESRLFFATNSGVGLYHRGENSIQLFNDTNSGLTQNRVLSVNQDSTGRYWIGTFTGVDNGFISQFFWSNAINGLLDETILGFAESADGRRWIGTAAGLHVIEAEDSIDQIAHFPLPGLGDTPITSLLPDGEDLWIGTFSHGLARLDTSKQSLVRYVKDIDDPSTISSNAITAMLRDTYGNLWVGTSSGGLNLMRPGEKSFQRFMHSPIDESSLSNDRVYAIYQERNGDLWIGTSRGLNRYNYETGAFDRFEREQDASGLTSEVVYSLYEDSQARLWIGTSGGGLNVWDSLDRKRSIPRLRHFQQNIELPSSTVYAIQGDENDNVWMSTTGGITRFNVDTMDYKHYTIKDGLQSNDFNLGASYRDRAGKIYFGGSKGFNAFFPGVIQDNPVKPPVVLTRIAKNNEPLHLDVPYSEVSLMEMEHDDYMLSFEFAALDFNAPKKNQYRYQLVGLNKSWVDLGNKNTVDFTNLQTGQYVFRIAGSNADGIWNEDGVSVAIVVNPPPWMTWWAFLLYISGALLTVLFVIERQKHKERLQMQYQSQLESDVRSRTRDLKRANDNLQIAVEEASEARQEAVEANKAKSEFLAALSHEIRTPMHGVLGMTDLLLHSGLGERQAGFAASAHESANELLGLIDNILDFSKIEAGKLELEETTFNLREVTENLCYLYGEMAQAKGIELNLIFRAELRRQVYGDPVRLRQIVQNLLSNAIKFTRRGAVNVSVEEIAREDKSSVIRFVVEDTGIGMDDETLERIFEAFSQADTSTTRQFGGTGLGLSIAKQLIELMDGKLDVNSKPGVGTRMSVELSFTESPIYVDKLSISRIEDFYAEVVATAPETRDMLTSQLDMLGLQSRPCSSVEEVSPRADKNRLVLVDVGAFYDNASIAQVQNLSDDELTTVLLVAPLSLDGIPSELRHLGHTTKPCRIGALLNDIFEALSPDGEHSDEAEEAPVLRFLQRVLVVEDMMANQEIARAMLESFGCKVDIAKNGDVAVEVYQQNHYDIILMDCQMPVMDGFEATRHIRRLESQKKGNVRTPIVAVTAGKTEVEKDRCYASGMDRILFKPYSTAELNNILAYYFEPAGTVEIEAPPEPASPAPLAEVTADLLDEKALDNIRSVEAQTGNNLLAKVFENFRQDTELKIEELRSSLDDGVALASGAHAIKSMALNIGAKALGEYCRECEADWKSDIISDADRRVEVLFGHYQDAVRALEPIIGDTADTES